MVSAGVPPPVLKPVEETVAVQPTPKPRLSVTWTLPRSACTVPPTTVEPRSELIGVLMDKAPAMTPTLTAQRGSVLPAGQLLPGSAETAALVRTRPPVSGLSIVTE